MSSGAPTHWCYNCRQPVTLRDQNGFCANCCGEFVQELEDLPSVNINEHNQRPRFLEAMSNFWRQQRALTQRSSNSNVRGRSDSVPQDGNFWGPWPIYSGDMPVRMPNNGGLLDLFNEVIGFRRVRDTRNPVSMARALKRGKHTRISNDGHCFNEHDFISKLTDDILLKILHKLPTEEAMATSVLSSRWRDLWKSLFSIDLNDRFEEKGKRKVFGLVKRFIKHYEGHKMKRFCVSVKYDSKKKKQYQSWMAFAVNKNVEELYLDLTHNKNKYRVPLLNPNLKLPNNICDCRSLVRLKITFVTLESLPPFHFALLKELHLNKTQLSDGGTETITSNCPMLETLLLTNCNMNRSLKITIAADSHISKLIIKDGYLRVIGTTDILINAPKIKVLEFFSGTSRRAYFIENVPAVVEARLSFDEMFAEATIRMIYPYGTERKFEGLLENFQAAKELHLCGMCIQFLTIQKLMNQENLQFNLKRLLLDTGLRKREVPGIAFLLNACPQLEQLVIIFLNRQPEFQFTTDLVRSNNFVEARYWGNQGTSVASCVKSLASVEFKDSWGSYQTWDSGKFQLDKFFAGWENGYEFLKFLKLNSPNLERLVFTTSKQQHQVECHF